MIYPYKKVFVVGAALQAGSANDIALAVEQLVPANTVSIFPVDTSPAGIATQFTTEESTVINLNELKNWQRWASAGKITTVIAGHEDMPRDPFDPSLPEYQWGWGIGLLASLAGVELPFVQQQLAASPSEIKALAAHLITVARRHLAQRQLRVLTLTERPLLGADSVLVMDSDALPVFGVDPLKLQQITTFYQAAADVCKTENLLSVSAAEVNPARALGSGAGYGVGAVAGLLRGFRGRALEAFFNQNQLLSQVDAESLVVALIPQLHPQTAAESVLSSLKELTVHAGAPLIVFADECSLAKHELAQWNVSAAYAGVRKPQSLADFLRILTGTWLRPR